MTVSDSNPVEGDFMRLFVRNERELRSYARMLLPTWEAVDDALQEASVVMWKKLDQLEDESGFLPWARMILRFEALKCRRNAARSRLVLSEEAILALADQAADSPTGTLERERVALRECLREFSDEHRRLLFAPYAAEGEIKGIAEGSNRTANSLYKLLGRLRAKLSLCVERRLATDGAQS